MLIFYWLISLATTLILVWGSTLVFIQILKSYYWTFSDKFLIPLGILLTIGNVLNCINTFPFITTSP